MASALTVAAIYVRISRDKVGAGLGVERQERECRELAARLGWTIPDRYVFVDNDVSAYSGKPRPDYLRLLNLIRSGKVAGVISWHTDRLHRSPVELEEFIDVIADRCQVQTAKAGPIDLTTAAGRMVARQLGAVARYESEHRAERQRSKKDEIARAGGFLGGVRPFGYESDGMTVRPDEAAAISKACADLLSGGSLRQVVRDWNEAGFRTTRTGADWNTNTVRQVLERPRNAALLLHRSNVVGPASWPALVSEETWRGVTAIFDDPARRQSPGNQPRWLGSLIFECVCGTTMTVGRSGAGKYSKPTYKCPAKKVPGEAHASRGAEALDDYISNVIIGALQGEWRDVLRVEKVAPDADALRTELKAVRETREALARDQVTGRITYAQFSTMNDGALAREQEIEHELADLVGDDPVSVALDSGDPEQYWRDLDLSRRRTLLKAMLRVVVRPGRKGPGFDAASIDVYARATGELLG